jgi:hypothetical protein
MGDGDGMQRQILKRTGIISNKIKEAGKSKGGKE